MAGRIPFVSAVLCLAALALLTGCEQVGSDGYVFERKQYDQQIMVIAKVEHKSLAELRAAAPTGTPGRDNLFGWSVLRKDGSCEMHVLDPTVRHEPEHFGHESEHCFYGEFHPSQQGDQH